MKALRIITKTGILTSMGVGSILIKKNRCVVPDPNPHASLVRAVYEA